MDPKGKTEPARFHLPGLFEFFEFYKRFLPLYAGNRDYFYEGAVIASLYGAPADCLWSGGRFGGGTDNAREVLSLTREYGISARLTFSNSLLTGEHLEDGKCNRLCRMFEQSETENGVVVHSEQLTRYLREHYPGLYLVSSTTKVLTDFTLLRAELARDEFRFVVPDFRFNNRFDRLEALSAAEKEKVELLCNEGCHIGCKDRKACYESVSRQVLGGEIGFVCRAPEAENGYVFSEAMKSPAFIGAEEIRKRYLPLGLTNFKLEGRNLGTALILEILLYYLVKPEYRLPVREKMYLNSMLDLF